MANTTAQPITNDNTQDNKPKVTFADLQDNPQGLTLLAQTAQLFNRHSMTIRRWIKSNPDFPRPLTINGMYYFKNSDLLAFVNDLEEA